MSEHNKTMNRRQFNTRSAIAITATTLGTLSALGASRMAAVSAGVTRMRRSALEPVIDIRPSK